MQPRYLLIAACGATLAALYLANASWLAHPPTGRPTIIAQRGVHQHFAGR